MPFETSALAQVIVKVQAGVVDQDIESFDILDSILNLRGVGHIQGQGCDTPIGMCKGLPRSRIHPLRASPQGFLGQCPSDATVCAGDQDCLVFDVIPFSFENVVLSVGYYALLAGEDTSQSKDFGFTMFRLLEVAPLRSRPCGIVLPTGTCLRVGR